MSWKPSKRQAQLKTRLIDSSRVYWSTSRQLDQMLLKMLHNNGVYTPDDLYNRYISKDASSGTKLKAPRAYDKPNSAQQLNETLNSLNQVIVQLKNLIKSMAKNNEVHS